MSVFLLIILIIIEAGFATFELTQQSLKSKWNIKKMIINIIELVVYLLMVFLPGIDLSFRFKGLLILLGLRILISGIISLIQKNNKEIKKKFIIILSAVLSIILIALSLIPSFIITDYHGLELTGEYDVRECSAILTDLSRIEEFESDGSYREVPVHFYYPENIEGIEEGTLPLIIFSHGAFGYYQSNTSTYMELASHGYVVASLDHPYHSFFTKDTEGHTIIVDPEFFNSALTIGNSDYDAISEEEIYEITSKWMKLREDDMNFVIDTLIMTGTSQTIGAEWYLGETDEDTILNVLESINYDKIGLMGHSLGGATAVTVGRRDDVSAVIDLDGTMLGEEAGVEDGVVLFNEESYDTPLLSVESEIHHESLGEYEEVGAIYVNSYVIDNASEGFEVYFKDTDHMNFTDLPLISPFLASNLGIGDRDSKECIKSVNALVLRFFDCYLKDEGDFSCQECY